MSVQKIKAPSGKWFEDQFNLKDLLTLSIAVNRINGGYIKKDAVYEKDENGDAEKLPNLFIINNAMGIEKFKNKSIEQSLSKYYPNVTVIDDDYTNVDHMVRYFKGLSLKAIKRSISDFEQTILGLISKEYVQYKDVGVIASLPNVYANGQTQKDFNKIEKKLAKDSKHIGELHARGEFTLEFIHVKYIWRSASYLFVAKDNEDNLVKFFSSHPEQKKGDIVTVTGYVKDHTIGKQSGGPETYLNRVKFVTP
jgi:hypothetical protein